MTATRRAVLLAGLGGLAGCTTTPRKPELPPEAPVTSWTYPKCFVEGVYDCDTITVNMDLGQDMWVMRRSVRLVGVAARELREPGGIEARDALRGLLPIGSRVMVQSTGWDKYAGRIDGVVTHLGPLDNGPAVNVNQLLVQLGWAVPWDGKGPQPKPAWPRSER
jgi:endonuclease YncB( thermonuclease family)